MDVKCTKYGYIRQHPRLLDRISETPSQRPVLSNLVALRLGGVQNTTGQHTTARNVTSRNRRVGLDNGIVFALRTCTAPFCVNLRLLL
jgi:hypothetical protein